MKTSASDKWCPFTAMYCQRDCALLNHGQCGILTLVQAAASIAEDIRQDSPKITRSLENLKCDVNEIKRRR